MTSLDSGGTHDWEQKCANVSLRDLARLLHIDCPDEAQFSRIVFALRRLREGESLGRAGDKFHSLYVVRSGCFKTVYTDLSGSEQVMGFPMSGDLMGADGIDSGRHQSTATSLSGGEVVILPFASRRGLAGECTTLESLFYHVLGRELVRVQNVAWTLGTLGSEGRVAAFLLSLSARLGALGYSSCSFDLCMTRHDIGSHLGLKLETVSRALSALNSSGIIRVRNRHIVIVDAGGLRRVIDPDGASTAGTAVQMHLNAARAAASNWMSARRPLLQPGLA
jgi:CRP/FNR family transcriptional regulator